MKLVIVAAGFDPDARSPEQSGADPNPNGAWGCHVVDEDGGEAWFVPTDQFTCEALQRVGIPEITAAD